MSDTELPTAKPRNVSRKYRTVKGDPSRVEVWIGNGWYRFNRWMFKEIWTPDHKRPADKEPGRD